MRNKSVILFITKNRSLEIVISELLKNAFPNVTIHCNNSYAHLQKYADISILIIDNHTVPEPSNTLYTPKEYSYPWLLINGNTQTQAEWAKKGYAGVIDKKHSIEHLTKAIKQIINGELWFSREILSQTLKNMLEQPYSIMTLNDTLASQYQLTEKEALTCQLLMNGLSNHEISLKCHISINTVKTHVSRLYTKLNVHSRQEMLNLIRHSYHP